MERRVQKQKPARQHLNFPTQEVALIFKILSQVMLTHSSPLAMAVLSLPVAPQLTLRTLLPMPCRSQHQVHHQWLPAQKASSLKKKQNNFTVDAIHRSIQIPVK